MEEYDPYIYIYMSKLSEVIHIWQKILYNSANIIDDLIAIKCFYCHNWIDIDIDIDIYFSDPQTLWTLTIDTGNLLYEIIIEVEMRGGSII